MSVFLSLGRMVKSRNIEVIQNLPRCKRESLTRPVLLKVIAQNEIDPDPLCLVGAASASSTSIQFPLVIASISVWSKAYGLRWQHFSTLQIRYFLQWPQTSSFDLSGKGICFLFSDSINLVHCWCHIVRICNQRFFVTLYLIRRESNEWKDLAPKDTTHA